MHALPHLPLMLNTGACQAPCDLLFALQTPDQLPEQLPEQDLQQPLLPSVQQPAASVGAAADLLSHEVGHLQYTAGS